jgi:uncharacterized caspase-like protein
MTQEASRGDPGIGMDELLALANKIDGPREVLLILDCCHSGAVGNPASMQSDIVGKALLREGVTILAASRPEQTAAEMGGHGMFTAMVLHALHGGAADVLGNVSAAGIYALVDQAYVDEYTLGYEQLKARAAEALRAGGVDDARTFDTVASALDAARGEASEDDLVLVTGSFYTVGDVRPLFVRA